MMMISPTIGTDTITDSQALLLCDVTQFTTILIDAVLAPRWQF